MRFLLKVTQNGVSHHVTFCTQLSDLQCVCLLFIVKVSGSPALRARLKTVTGNYIYLLPVPYDFDLNWLAELPVYTTQCQFYLARVQGLSGIKSFDHSIKQK